MTAIPERIKGDTRFTRVLGLVLAVCLIGVLGAAFLREEFESSELQSKVLSSLADEMTFEVLPANRAVVARYPTGKGPYDQRLGYSGVPGFIDSLQQHGFVLSQRASLTKRHAEFIDMGMFPIYRVKAQAGLDLRDRKDRVLYHMRYPQRFYRNFQEIPKVVVDTLLFIEDRQLLDPDAVRRNPAVEWDRLGRAVLDLGISVFNSNHHVQGGSTLATQMEKFRHSPRGLTKNPREKLRQMFSAALRAYSGGEHTVSSRRRIALDYMNSVPLAALPGFGEISGLGDGLWGYFKADFDRVNDLLRGQGRGQFAELEERAQAYRQVLSLFLAHRRPSDYLGNDPRPLRRQVDRYLPVLHKQRIIDTDLYQAASRVDAQYTRETPRSQATSFVARKASDSIRTELLSLLDVPSLYDLDRLDMVVSTSLDREAQRGITEFLAQLATPELVKQRKLIGRRLLSERQDLSKIIYSFTLYQSLGEVNHLRVQTDSLDRPFNVNAGGKLDLGSTAKLRTLLSYLELIAETYSRYSKFDRSELKSVLNSSLDPLTNWVVSQLRTERISSLEELLSAAMLRGYSASPREKFFTAGGLHTFGNFNKRHNSQVLTVEQALRHSVNLPFIRIMRDIVSHLIYRTHGVSLRSIRRMPKDQRVEYLRRFALYEGERFLASYLKEYRKHRLPLEVFRQHTGNSRERFASVYSIVEQRPSATGLDRFLERHFDQKLIERVQIDKLYDKYFVQVDNLSDRAYLAKVHPLELWLAGYLSQHPRASYDQILDASRQARIDAYTWLFETKSRSKQDQRIRIALEREAFVELHRRWQRVGYPHSSLVPSYATALGTSADTPAALAELMGILLNDGQRLPIRTINRIQIAQNTPYEAQFDLRQVTAEQVVHPAIAAEIREALADVVQRGSAIRLRKGYQGRSGNFAVLGKTGTGDHRYKVFAPDGTLRESRVVNRTATFAFILGDDFFGTISAFVPGGDAKDYNFTSSLPVELLKQLEPILLPLVDTG